jgi:hypothetical protein
MTTGLVTNASAAKFATLKRRALHQIRNPLSPKNIGRMQSFHTHKYGRIVKLPSPVSMNGLCQSKTENPSAIRAKSTPRRICDSRQETGRRPSNP